MSTKYRDTSIEQYVNSLTHGDVATSEQRLHILESLGMDNFLNALFANCVVTDGSTTIEQMKNDIKLKICNAEGEELKNIHLLFTTIGQVLDVLNVKQ